MIQNQTTGSGNPAIVSVCREDGLRPLKILSHLTRHQRISANITSELLDISARVCPSKRPGGPDSCIEVLFCSQLFLFHRTMSQLWPNHCCQSASLSKALLPSCSDISPSDLRADVWCFAVCAAGSIFMPPPISRGRQGCPLLTDFASSDLVEI